MSHAGSGGDDSIGVRCEHCGKLFLEERSKGSHEATCGPDGGDDDGDSGAGIGSPSDDNEDYNRLVNWLRKQTAGGEQVRFKSRYIDDELDLSPNQIGVYMSYIVDVDEFDVTSIGYSSATMWEVRQA